MLFIQQRHSSISQSVSQSVSQEKIDNFANFVFTLRRRRSRVFLWLATADMASLLLSEGYRPIWSTLNGVCLGVFLT